MGDDVAEAQKARVLALYEKWAEPLGLHWQRKVSFAWHRGAIPDYKRAVMSCSVDWQYKSAEVSIDLCRVADTDDAHLEFVLIHELGHIFLGGLVDAHTKKVDGDAFRMIEEHTATTLAQAFLWLRAHCERSSEATA